MTSKVTVNLPKLHPAQQACIDKAQRFNLVCAGEDAGKTTLGIEVLLTSPKGAFNSRKPVCFISPTDEGADEARRAVVRALGPLVKRRLNARRIELASGGMIDFISLEQTRDVFEAYGLIVVDNACQIERLVELWDDVLQTCLSQHNGHAWILSVAYGIRNGFHQLWQRQMGAPGWAHHHFDSFANPHLPAETAAEAMEVSGIEFDQRFGSKFTESVVEFSSEQRLLKPNETFIEWCERLEETGLKVDGQPFTLSNRPAMRFIYELIPSTVKEAFDRVDVIMKCTQVGFTVFEMLAMIYLALRFSPAKIGMFMPARDLASGKSSERFMPIVRTMPDVYSLFSDEKQGKKGGEGNVLIRNLGSSRFHFLWTSGKATTESFPMDVVSFDEVQEMRIADMEKTRERMSASPVRYTLMGSTANWPDEDIHWWYKKGTQHQFWTECQDCGTHQVLDDHFPECIAYDPDAPRHNEREREAGMKGEYRYRCHECGGWIADPQIGEWRAKNPDSPIRSVHFPQFLSPTISPRKIITGYHEADDMKNFFNRVLGKPYTDPSQVPVNLEMLNECAKEGMAAGLVWKSRSSGAFMGLDQMGNFIVAVIGERMPDGRLAIIHMEYIFISPTKEDPDASPWRRCDELMEAFGIQVCVVETLPNYDSAKSFARRHHGKVFLAGYGNMEGDMLAWGDTIKLSSSENRTDEEMRDRYTVRLDQYKVMQLALGRIQKKMTLFPDPEGLVQDVLEKGKWRTSAVCKEYAFFHFTRTALVAEKDEEERKFRRRVVKVGIDPHTSYAYMLLVVAWARAHGTSMFILPQESASPSEIVGERLAKIPSIANAVAQVQHLFGDVCGRCTARNDATGMCGELQALTLAKDPGCPMFIARR
jgi:hypothetical protein